MEFSFDPQAYLHKQKVVNNIQIDEMKAMLYATSIGFSEDPTDTSDLRYTYEQTPGFQIFPTLLSTAFVWNIYAGQVFIEVGLGGIPFANIIHAGVKLFMYRPLRLNEKIEVVAELDGVKDVGKATLTRIKYTFLDEEKQIIANYYSMDFIKGLRAGGHQSEGFEKIPTPPKTPPTKVVEYQTTPNLAFIYRLNGDINPLHVDYPEAQRVGFERPILHGLCFYGIANRIIVKEFGDNDASRIKTSEATFISYVYPGERLRVSCWQNGNKILFVLQNIDRNTVCETGVVELWETAKL